MTEETKQEKNSQLIAALREGISVVQMIVFKELRNLLSKKHTDQAPTYAPMLAGALVNELFGSINTEEKFLAFHKENKATIEQQFLALPEELPGLCKYITDALRIQVLCDNQEGEDSSHCLLRAEEWGILQKEREVPLPSTFMTIIRMLGEQYNFITPPVQITPEDDAIVH